MGKSIRIFLNAHERHTLEKRIRAGHDSARTLTRARILLLADRSQGHRRTDLQIAQALLCHRNTVANVRHRFA